MIIDSLENADLYIGLHRFFGAGFDYLRHLNRKAPDGKDEINGDQLFALPQCYLTGSPDDKKFESHRKYIDIQYVVSGEECILHAPIARLTAIDKYSAKKDVLFYKDPPACTTVLLRAGDFAIFYANDGHKPGCSGGRSGLVTKIVIKVAI